MKATAKAALATTGDCDPLRLTSCAGATVTAQKWVIESGSSHHMCHVRSSVSTFTRLSLPILIELRHDNSVTALHYGFVNVIQGYQVEALHISTFRPYLVAITQLDLGRHTAHSFGMDNAP